MRIAHINPSFSPATYYGGPTESGRALVRALSDAGADVRVLTTDANGPRERVAVETGREFAQDGYRIEYARRVLPESVAPGLALALRERIAWADVVHLTAVYNFTTLPALAVARALHKPVIWTPRGAHLRWQGSRKVAAKRLWDRACRELAPAHFAVHATSEREAEAVRVAMPGVRAVVIPNGIEIPEAAPHRVDPRLRLLFLGRLDPIKGIDRLLAALAELALPNAREWVLRIAGTGDSAYRDGLERAVPRDIRTRVEWLGDVRGEDKAQLFQDTDLLVLPSHSENFGMAAAEALAHGVPVIASKGTPWAGLEEHHCGRWTENTPTALAEAIRSLATEDLRAAGERGRTWMQQDYAWPIIAKRFLALASSL
jgi:glycosyltransferase involved in cell wall biosynthesis